MQTKLNMGQKINRSRANGGLALKCGKCGRSIKAHETMVDGVWTCGREECGGGLTSWIRKMAADSERRKREEIFALQLKCRRNLILGEGEAYDKNIKKLHELGGKL